MLLAGSGHNSLFLCNVKTETCHFPDDMQEAKSGLFVARLGTCPLRLARDSVVLARLCSQTSHSCVPTVEEATEDPHKEYLRHQGELRTDFEAARPLPGQQRTTPDEI